MSGPADAAGPTPVIDDPGLLESAWLRLCCIADEGAAVLRRSACSTLVRECNDYAVVLADADGAAIAENAAGRPLFLGAPTERAVAITAALPPRLQRRVEGGHLFFIGEAGARATVAAAIVLHHEIHETRAIRTDLDQVFGPSSSPQQQGQRS
jgi:hypothetical protein